MVPGKVLVNISLSLIIGHITTLLLKSYISVDCLPAISAHQKQNWYQTATTSQVSYKIQMPLPRALSNTHQQIYHPFDAFRFLTSMI
jgi:hypothetical protein